VGSVYGALAYGSGRYGGADTVGAPYPPAADRPAIAQHILGVGPWAAGVHWKASPNYGLVPSAGYPSQAVLPLATAGLQAASFTLRRTKASEARVELNQPRGSSLVVEEMVTDLWWIRRDPRVGITESIGRFNADAVDASMTDGRLSTAATFVDYRGMMEGRLVTLGLAIVGWGAGTSVTQIMRDAKMFPEDMLCDLSALTNVDLGVTEQPLKYDLPIPCTEAIGRLQAVSPPFDWGFETPLVRGTRPTLKLWPGSRGTNRGVTLVDDGSSFGPIRTWRMRTNREDFANYIYFVGANDLAKDATTTETHARTGQRDAVGNDPDKILAAEVQHAADRMLLDRNVRLAAWDVTLAPGFWRGRSHIDVGDTVRLIIHLGADRLDYIGFVEEITVRVSANGPEEVSLTLGWGYPSADPQSKLHPIAKIVKELRRLDRRR
jgi:hypothetical protein